MLQLTSTLLFSALGGTLLLHLLKNFSLRQKTKLRLDYDGLLERLLVTYVIINIPDLWFIILLVIAARVFYRLYLLGFLTAILRSNEPGSAAQKVRIKAELAFDLITSPAFAILVGVVSK